MSKTIELLTINNLIIGVHDKDDMHLLGTFLVSMSQTNLERLGLHGACEIKYSGGDYMAVFSNGGILARKSPLYSSLYRQHICPAEECKEKTLSVTAKADFCWNHKKEFLCLDEARDEVA